MLFKSHFQHLVFNVCTIPHTIPMILRLRTIAVASTCRKSSVRPRITGDTTEPPSTCSLLRPSQSCHRGLRQLRSSFSLPILGPLSCKQVKHLKAAMNLTRKEGWNSPYWVLLVYKVRMKIYICYSPQVKKKQKIFTTFSYSITQTAQWAIHSTNLERNTSKKYNFTLFINSVKLRNPNITILSVSFYVPVLCFQYPQEQLNGLQSLFSNLLCCNIHQDQPQLTYVKVSEIFYRNHIFFFDNLEICTNTVK